jgi:hypothetical protein
MLYIYENRLIKIDYYLRPSKISCSLRLIFFNSALNAGDPLTKVFMAGAGFGAGALDLRLLGTGLLGVRLLDVRLLGAGLLGALLLFVRFLDTRFSGAGLLTGMNTDPAFLPTAFLPAAFLPVTFLPAVFLLVIAFRSAGLARLFPSI